MSTGFPESSTQFGPVDLENMGPINIDYNALNQWAAEQDGTAAPQEQGSGTSEEELRRRDNEAAMARQLQQQQWEEAQAAAARKREQDQIISTVRSVFSQYGLSSLNSVIEQYARQDYSGAAIEIALRETPQYKQRFPAMDALRAKGRAITEGEYIEYERTAAALERQYGLPRDMLTGNVTNLLTNEVSPTELNDRVILAASAAIQAPQDFRQTMSDYYNIDLGGLTAYFLDPQVATPLLEKQYATSLIGVEARRQGIGIDVYGAQNLQELGISQEEARQGFAQVRRQEGLTAGRGDVVSQQQLISGTFGDEQNRRAIERAQQARTGRFQQGGGALTTQGGVVGAGTAATR